MALMDSKDNKALVNDNNMRAAMREARFDSNVKKYATNVYRVLVSKGLRPVVINERYIELGGNEYQFILRGGAEWTLKRYK